MTNLLELSEHNFFMYKRGLVLLSVSVVVDRTKLDNINNVANGCQRRGTPSSFPWWKLFIFTVSWKKKTWETLNDVWRSHVAGWETRSPTSKSVFFYDTLLLQEVFIWRLSFIWVRVGRMPRYDCFGKDRNPQCLQAIVTRIQGYSFNFKVEACLDFVYCCFVSVLTPRNLLHCKNFLY